MIRTFIVTYWVACTAHSLACLFMLHVHVTPKHLNHLIDYTSLCPLGGMETHFGHFANKGAGIHTCPPSNRLPITVTHVSQLV